MNRPKIVQKVGAVVMGYHLDAKGRPFVESGAWAPPPWRMQGFEWECRFWNEGMVEGFRPFRIWVWGTEETVLREFVVGGIPQPLPPAVQLQPYMGLSTFCMWLKDHCSNIGSSELPVEFDAHPWCVDDVRRNACLPWNFRRSPEFDNNPTLMFSRCSAVSGMRMKITGPVRGAVVWGTYWRLRHPRRQKNGKSNRSSS